jgi:YcaO-like protein with predicted kinase domain
VSTAFRAHLASDSSIEFGGHSFSTEDTFRKACVGARQLGVTRVAETTGLDVLGIPTFYAVRPAARDASAIISSGKGLTPGDALNSALLEAHERWGAEEPEGPVIRYSRKGLATVFPEGLCTSSPQLEPNEIIEWAVGFDLISESWCFVPLVVCVYPYLNDPPVSWPFASSTSGLASACNPTEALCSAIYELIERLAIGSQPVDSFLRIDLSSLPPIGQKLFDRFRRVGLELSLNWVQVGLKPTVLYCLCRDDNARISAFFCRGSAAHMNSETALIRTLTEVAQSRASIISSLRFDISELIKDHENIQYESRRAELNHFFSTAASTAFDQLPSNRASSSQMELKALTSEFSGRFPGLPLACVPLRSVPNIFTFRAVCAEVL